MKDICYFLITFCRPESNYLTETLFQKSTFKFSIINLAVINQVMKNFELYLNFKLARILSSASSRIRLDFTDRPVKFLRSLKK